MSKQVHVVRVNDPPAHYKPGYFPRKFSSLIRAKVEAQRAVELGASMARVEVAGGGELDYRPKQDKAKTIPLPNTKVTTRERPAPTLRTGIDRSHEDFVDRLNRAVVKHRLRLAEDIEQFMMEEKIPKEYTILTLLQELKKFTL